MYCTKCGKELNPNDRFCANHSCNLLRKNICASCMSGKKRDTIFSCLVHYQDCRVYGFVFDQRSNRANCNAACTDKEDHLHFFKMLCNTVFDPLFHRKFRKHFCFCLMKDRNIRLRRYPDLPNLFPKLVCFFTAGDDQYFHLRFIFPLLL